MEKFVVRETPVDVMGVPIHGVTLDGALNIIDEAIAARQQLHIGVVNAAKIVNMERDPELRDGVLQSDFVLADGMAVVWASKLLPVKTLPERVTGIDLMFGMFKRGMSKGYRVFLLGATEEVSAQVAERLSQDFPGVVLAGRRDGYFTPDQEREVAQSIADSNADILLVAITSPKKEKFMAKWAETMGIPVVHGVGGSFDVMAGKVQRAPEVWQKYGLEWLYRVKQEPGRLWKRYLVTNLLFFKRFFKSLVGLK